MIAGNWVYKFIDGISNQMEERVLFEQNHKQNYKFRIKNALYAFLLLNIVTNLWFGI